MRRFRLFPLVGRYAVGHQSHVGDAELEGVERLGRMLGVELVVEQLDDGLLLVFHQVVGQAANGGVGLALCHLEGREGDGVGLPAVGKRYRAVETPHGGLGKPRLSERLALVLVETERHEARVPLRLSVAHGVDVHLDGQLRTLAAGGDDVAGVVDDIAQAVAEAEAQRPRAGVEASIDSPCHRRVAEEAEHVPGVDDACCRIEGQTVAFGQIVGRHHLYLVEEALRDVDSVLKLAARIGCRSAVGAERAEEDAGLAEHHWRVGADVCARGLTADMPGSEVALGNAERNLPRGGREVGHLLLAVGSGQVEMVHKLQVAPAERHQLASLWQCTVDGGDGGFRVAAAGEGTHRGGDIRLDRVEHHLVAARMHGLDLDGSPALGRGRRGQLGCRAVEGIVVCHVADGVADGGGGIDIPVGEDGLGIVDALELDAVLLHEVVGVVGAHLGLTLPDAKELVGVERDTLCYRRALRSRQRGSLDVFATGHERHDGDAGEQIGMINSCLHNQFEKLVFTE